MSTSPHHQTSHNISQNTPTPQLSPEKYPLDVEIDTDGEVEVKKLSPLEKKFFKAAMSLKWDKVCDLFEKEEQVRLQKITQSNDTVLHFAICSAKEKDVLRLLSKIKELTMKDEQDKILRAKNNNGSTPLHLAAALGFDNVCRHIVYLKPGIMKERNKKGETPLFSAVRHGKKNTFVVLVAAIRKQNKKTLSDTNHTDRLDSAGRNLTTQYFRRSDGNTILHYAIQNERFDLAYWIAEEYSILVNYVNSSGESALHTLAYKPYVFKSGTRLGPLDRIIYHYTTAELLQSKSKDITEKIKFTMDSPLDKDETVERPATYKVFDLFCMIKKFFKASNDQEYCRNKSDLENQQNQEQRKRRRSRNPTSFAVSFFKIIINLLLIFLGIGLIKAGLRGIHKIRKLKQKNEEAKEIMKVLVDKSTLWWVNASAEVGGMKPQPGFSQLPDLIKSSLPPPTPSEEGNDSVSQKEQPNQSKANTLMSTDNRIMIAAKDGGRDMLKNVLEKFSLEAKNVDKKDIIIVGMEEKKSSGGIDIASPVLVAAKGGIKEMVKQIIQKFPVARFDRDTNGKNIILLAVEHRQVHVYKLMMKNSTTRYLSARGDKKGNTALHLAAMLSHNRPWSIPGAALQMQWEIKWYKYVKETVAGELEDRTNSAGRLPWDIFTENHDALTKEGGSWLTSTSQSCSVVAALVATVAFATASQVPGGVNPDSGTPVLDQKPFFQLFAISALVALCFSVTSLVMFLSILTSRYQVRDFKTGLPVKLIVGLTCLFLSIASMLVSFCAGDFFVVNHNLKFAAYLIYAVMYFPVTIFALAQFPLYFDLLKATIKDVPEPTEKTPSF